MQKITTCFWFDNNLQEAFEFYSSIFDDAEILTSAKYSEVGPGKPGDLMFARFKLAGHEFMGINGGPVFKFNEAISLYVNCEDQAEVDRLWSSLTADGGSEGQCGWLKDKFGVSWQIIPKQLGELMGDPDPKKAQAVNAAMLKMQKINVSELQAAHDQA